MKYYTKLTRLLYAVLLLGFSLEACNPVENVYELKSEEDFVDQQPVSFDQINEVIPNEYIVFLNTDNPSGLYPALKELGDKNKVSMKSTTVRRQPTEDLQKSAQQLTDLTAITGAIIQKYGINSSAIKEVLAPSLAGLLISMSEEQALALEQDPDVEVVDEDVLVALKAAKSFRRKPFIPSDSELNVERQPYGVKRVGGSVNYEDHPEYNNRWAWIVDTGIDTDHPDLNVNTAFSRDFTKDKNFKDEHGHGTHVAGIIAAKKNSYGVTGVAAGAQLVAVKVLDKKGKGKKSSIIRGLAYIQRNCLPNDVVNISLGGKIENEAGKKKNKSLSHIFKKLDREDIHIIMAAGNSGKDVKEISPANIDGVNLYTVGAIDWEDQYTDYSNFGISVDFAAPGHGILSTFKDGKYAYMSGTSMAAPHVAGVMLLTGGRVQENGRAKSRKGDVPIVRH